LNQVSVIIPTWNRSGTIRRAVESALNQTFPVWEVLVCDDGSTDDTEAIIGKINDPRVHFIPGARAGRPAVPRNKGIAEAKGDWFAFLDSDDEWLPSKIEKQLTAAAVLNCKAACSNAFRITPSSGNQGPYFKQPLPDRILFSKLIHTNFIICSSALIHRSVFEQAKGFPEAPELKALEDYALWLRVAAQTDFAYVQEPLLNYLDDAEHSIRSKDEDVWAQRKHIFENLYDWSAKTPQGIRKRPDIKKAYRKALKMTGAGLLKRFLI
jgi:teichuronic acid biosynthesis glycosyltransferase TuaG